MKRFVVWVTLVASCLLPGTGFAAKNPLEISAKSAIVMVASTGEVLFEKNAEQRRYPASTTKIMTIITALEDGNLNDTVTAGTNAVNTEGSSMYLQTGDRLRLLDMLYGVALVSGNDAAVAIAEHIAGSVDSFAGRMTAKARSIGAMQTNFKNSSGLPDPNHYSTAHDLAKIAAYGYQNPQFVEIVGASYKKIALSNKQETYYNENKLLSIYRGANGVKTGYTDAAGRCLVSAAKRGNTQIITVVLDADFMWEDSMALLDYGFSQLQEQVVVQAGEIVESVGVKYGESGVAHAVLRDTIIVPVSSRSQGALQVVVDVAENINAPVAAGQSVGVVKVIYQNSEVASSTLIVTESIPEKRLLARIKDYFRNLFIGFAEMTILKKSA